MKIKSVSDIEKILADLTAKRASIVARSEEIAGRRKVLGFISLVGKDKEATAELEKLNLEASAVSGALDGIDGALSEGQRRLAVAKAAEANLADQKEAAEIAEQLEIFVRAGEEIDRALEVLVSGPKKMQAALTKMHSLGQDRPDHRQFSTFARNAVFTALRKTPWAQEFQILPVAHRRNFGELTKSWAAGIRSRIAHRLGAAEKEAA